MHRLYYILAFISMTFSLGAQVNQGGSPLWPEGYKSTGAYTVPSSEITGLIARSFSDDDLIYGKKPLRVGVDYQVELNPANSGEWIKLPDGTMLWRLEINSKGALALRLHFSHFRLKHGSRIFIYDPERKYVLGSFNETNNKPGGELPTAYLPGERLILELQVDKGSDFGDLSIGSISHALIDITGKAKKDGNFGNSDYCEVDINCDEGFDWQTLKRSVCRIIFKRSPSTTDLCTGTLINSARNDGKAYFYTANHCIRNSYEASNAVFYFGYEAEECDGVDPDPDGSLAMTISSATLLATSDSLDFSLLELSVNIPDEYQPYFAGWSISQVPPQKSVTIHHPYGDVKKISKDDDPALVEYQEINPPVWLTVGSTADAFWRIEDWELGTTEGGSSGCPLFNQDQRLVGNLTGGDARCSNSVNDYFSKFYMDWDYYSEPGKQLKYWLDNPDSSITYIDGYDPVNILSIYEFVAQNKDYTLLEKIISGTKYQELLSVDGIYSFFAPPDSSILKLPEWMVSILTEGPELLREQFTGELLLIGKKTYDGLITTPPEKNILEHSIRIELVNEDLYLNDSILIVDLPKLTSNGIIHPVIFTPMQQSHNPYHEWDIYPNPNNGTFFIYTGNAELENALIRIFDLQGNLITEQQFPKLQNTELSLDKYFSGIYIIELQAGKFLEYKRVVIINENR